MSLDPQARALLDQMIAMGGAPLHTLSVPEARQVMAALGAMQGPGEAVAEVINRTVPGLVGPIPIRIYRPSGATALPVLVYFHGGGWVLGNLDSHDGVCRALANAVPCLVVSVDYRLAPEHPFPAAGEDAYAATQWVAAHATDLGADGARIAVGGDSAGGNLAAVVALMARDRGEPALAFQLLVYPVTDAPGTTVSYQENADGYLLTADAMQWFWKHYAAPAANAYACPLRAASLAGLPPALVITAEFDPLRDEGEAYAARLRDAATPVELTRYDGMIHGFFGMAAVLDQAKAAVKQAGEHLRATFRR